MADGMMIVGHHSTTHIGGASEVVAAADGTTIVGHVVVQSAGILPSRTENHAGLNRYSSGGVGTGAEGIGGCRSG